MASMTTEALTLPGVLAEMERVAGREAAVAVALRFGGQRIYIPKPGALTQVHALSLCAGPGARQIAAHFGGDTLAIPLANRELVAYLSAAGGSVRDIAARLRIHEATVRKYRRLGAMAP